MNPDQAWGVVGALAIVPAPKAGRARGDKMPHEVPPDIQQIVAALLINHMEVTGPALSGAKIVYRVNGHSLTEDELRRLSHKDLLTSWHIFNYTRIRAVKRSA